MECMEHWILLWIVLRCKVHLGSETDSLFLQETKEGKNVFPRKLCHEILYNWFILSFSILVVYNIGGIPEGNKLGMSILEGGKSLNLSSNTMEILGF